MGDIASVETSYGDFKRVIPLENLTKFSAGGLAAWMDFCAALCRIDCAEKADARLTTLARAIASDLMAIRLNPDLVHDALRISGYPYRTAFGAQWPISLSRILSGDTSDSMQAISKGEAKAMQKHTENYLIWRAEVAARHGGDYKSFMNTLMEMAGAHQGFIEARDTIRLNQEVMQLTRRANQMAVMGRK